jgi:hypothetical protein
MTKLDEMIAEREQKIWKQARNVARGAAGAAAASAARGPS